MITGEDYNLLKTDTPQSRKKVNALATVLYIPVIVWIAIGYLMVSQMFPGSKLPALISAAVFGLLIFLIEKNIIMAHSSRAIYFFRIALGCVIALLGAICLDEAAFKEDINQQLSEINIKKIDAGISEVVKLNTAVISIKQKDLDKKYVVWQEALNDAKKEADGSGGSGRKGVHAIARMKLRAADVCLTDYEKTKKELEALNAKQDAEKIEAKENVRSSFREGALLNRIKALFQLVFSDLAMGIVYFLITAFLFFLEFMVVFLKNAWPLTNYDRRLELIEEIGHKRMEKISKNGSNHFEPGTVNPAFRLARNAIQNNSSTSLFN
ncbi:MAG: DUF4407 domain-containing protein [Candidatus Saccharimonadaceae bacterium]